MANSAFFHCRIHHFLLAKYILGGIGVFAWKNKGKIIKVASKVIKRV
jgi:hypothetical protein